MMKVRVCERARVCVCACWAVTDADGKAQGAGASQQLWSLLESTPAIPTSGELSERAFA